MVLLVLLPARSQEIPAPRPAGITGIPPVTPLGGQTIPAPRPIDIGQDLPVPPQPGENGMPMLPSGQLQTIPSSPTGIQSATLLVASRPMVAKPPLAIKNNVLMLPLRPIADGLLADLTINHAERTVTIRRADDNAQVVYDGKNSTLYVGSVAQGPQENTALVDLTPNNEAFPQNLIERMFNVFINSDFEKREVQVIPNSAAFAEALSTYEADQTTSPASRLPSFNLNAVQSDSQLLYSNLQRTGQVTNIRTTSQINQTVINTYLTYVGSAKGPGFTFSMGGVQASGKHFNIQVGDYVLRNGSLLASGINRGITAEYLFGFGTKVGLSVGALQSSTRRIGLQQQVPLFQRDMGLAYFNLDSRDLKSKSPFWIDHRFRAAGGLGGFADRNNPQFHDRGYLTYLQVHDELSRRDGNFQNDLLFDLGFSQARRDTTQVDSKYHEGNVYIFRDTATINKRLTLGTLVQSGSPRWSTLDISNAYRNQFVWQESASYEVMQGLNVNATRSVSQTTAGNLPKLPTTIYSAGTAFSRYPTILPVVSFNTSVALTQRKTAQVFNTMSFSQDLTRLLRTKVSGQWIFSNSGTTRNNGTTNELVSAFSLQTQTLLYKGLTASFNKLWATPWSSQTIVGVQTGGLFGRYMNGGFSIGKIDTPQGDTRLLTGNLNVKIPHTSETASVSFSRANEVYQVAVGVFGFVGRRGTVLSSGDVPLRTRPTTGTLEGRFYVDNNLSKTFELGVDTPIPNLRVTVNGAAVATTDVEGRYIVKDLAKGFVSVRTDINAIPARLAFLNGTSQDAFITPHKNTILDFRLGKFGRVLGTVQTNTGEVPSDLRLYLVGTDKDTLSNQGGSFDLADIVPGKYILKVDPDYVPADFEIVDGEASVEVLPGARLTGVKFQLKKIEGKVIEKRFSRRWMPRRF